MQHVRSVLAESERAQIHSDSSTADTSLPESFGVHTRCLGRQCHSRSLLEDHSKQILEDQRISQCARAREDLFSVRANMLLSSGRC